MICNQKIIWALTKWFHLPRRAESHWGVWQSWGCVFLWLLAPRRTGPWSCPSPRFLLPPSRRWSGVFLIALCRRYLGQANDLPKNKIVWVSEYGLGDEANSKSKYQFKFVWRIKPLRDAFQFCSHLSFRRLREEELRSEDSKYSMASLSFKGVNKEREICAAIVG